MSFGRIDQMSLLVLVVFLDSVFVCLFYFVVLDIEHRAFPLTHISSPLDFFFETLKQSLLKLLNSSIWT